MCEDDRQDIMGIRKVRAALNCLPCTVERFLVFADTQIGTGQKGQMRVMLRIPRIEPLSFFHERDAVAITGQVRLVTESVEHVRIVGIEFDGDPRLSNRVVLSVEPLVGRA